MSGDLREAVARAMCDRPDKCVYGGGSLSGDGSGSTYCAVRAWQRKLPVADAILALLRERGALVEWRPIESAPKDGTPVLVWVAAAHGLDPFITRCAWHDDAGWCADELREVTHWMPLPAAPSGIAGG